MAVPGSSASAFSIIRGALLDLGAISGTEQPTADEAQDALVCLNQMIDTWNADGLMIFTIAITDFPLVSNKQIYTLGSGGDFNMPRPAFIDRASIVILSNPNQPLEYPVPIYTTQNWQEKVPIKNVPGNLPLLIYDDGAFPLRNLTFWPVASDNTNVRLYPWQQLSQFQTLQTVLAFPPGYQEALRHNLTIRLAPQWRASVTPQTEQLAISALALIKTSNADDVELRSDLLGSNTPSRMRSELFNIP